MRPQASNPFSTRFVRPGAIPYLFPVSDSIEQLADRLTERRGRAAILGPHGSGKSTLLATLLPQLAARGWNPHQIALHDGLHWMPRGWTSTLSASAQLSPGSAPQPRQPRPLLVIDGYEQLNWLSRALVRIRCRVSGWGMLVTAHGPVSLPTIFETQTSSEVTLAICARLAPDVGVLTARDCDEAWAASRGNVREALFDLYDRYERTLAL